MKSASTISVPIINSGFTPSNPENRTTKLYKRDDGKLYTLDSNGIEEIVSQPELSDRDGDTGISVESTPSSDEDVLNFVVENLVVSKFDRDYKIFIRDFNDTPVLSYNNRGIYTGIDDDFNFEFSGSNQRATFSLVANDGAGNFHQYINSTGGTSPQSQSTGYGFHTHFSTNQNEMEYLVAPSVSIGSVQNWIKSLSFDMNNGDLIFHQYPDTRNDGTTNKVFYPGNNGELLVGDVSKQQNEFWNSSTQSISNTKTPLILDQTRLTSTQKITVSGDTITLENGLFSFDYSCSADVSNNNRTSVEWFVEIDNVLYDGSKSFSYHRTLGSGEDTASKKILIDATTSPKNVKIFGRIITGSGTISTIENSCNVVIEEK